MINQVLGVEMQHVPYRGTGPAMNDVVAGRIQVFTNALAPMQSQIEAGTVRALAIAGSRRNAALPNVPTTGEAGFPDIQAATWYALFATGETPGGSGAAFVHALSETLADPEVRGKLESGGLDVEPSESPARLRPFRRRGCGAVKPGGASRGRQRGVSRPCGARPLRQDAGKGKKEMPA